MVKNLIPWKRKRRDTGLTRLEDNPFEQLHHQINRLFDNFFDGTGEFGRMPSWGAMDQPWLRTAPDFEVSETDDEVRVKAELPGMDEKDIEVTLDENVLTIRGEKKHEREENKRSYYLSEVSYGAFHRSVPLPADIDRDKAKARFQKGVLTLTLPKLERARGQRRRIDVSAD